MSFIMKKTLALFTLAALPFYAFSTNPGDGKSPKAVADKIYINGKIITVNASNSVAQAVAVQGGKILEVGSTADISKLKGANTVVVDLGGKTVIPGFIDGHSHFMGLGRAKTANVAAPPVGPVKTSPIWWPNCRNTKPTRRYRMANGSAVSANDVDQLAEKRHPTKEDLDGAFRTIRW